jgi:hypothetical protein
MVSLSLISNPTMYPDHSKRCIYARYSYVPRGMRSVNFHGLCYRIFWLISFLVSTAVVAYLILRVWNKWNTSPVLVSFANVPTPVWNLPFPAITICPQVKIKDTLFNLSAILSNDNKTEEE